MKKAIVLGAGGHAKVVIDSCREVASLDLVGCLSQEPLGSIVNDLPIIGGDERIDALIADGIDTFVLAVGSNRVRLSLLELLLSRGATVPAVIHPAATVSPSAWIGEGAVVMAGAVINASARIGAACIVNTLSGIDHDCHLADGVHVAPNSGLAGNVSVGRRSFLGAGVTVIPGVTIGIDCMIGAGAVVTADVPHGETHIGVPARLMTAERSGRV